jgi:hypothetical protein
MDDETDRPASPRQPDHTAPDLPIGRSQQREDGSMKVLPAWLVDRLPLGWWRPGNLHRVIGGDLHFCDDDHVRSIEWNGRVIAQGRRLFPYDHPWE